MTTVASRTELYAEVQQFYAEQMQRLDNRDIPGYAATFTEDAEFEHTPGIPPPGPGRGSSPTWSNSTSASRPTRCSAGIGST
nr:nuclear transport factor 2 family protein [Nocardia araoensis]